MEMTFTKPPRPTPEATTPEATPHPPENPQPDPAASGSNDLPPPANDHLAALEAELLERQAQDEAVVAAAEEKIEQQALEARFVPVEVFTQTLGGGLQMAGHAVNLQTLVAGGKGPEFEAAAGAIYEIILDVPAFHFLISPGGKWFKRIMAIGAWAVPVGMGCMTELEERRRPKAKAPAAEDGSAPDAQTVSETVRPTRPAETAPEIVTASMDPVEEAT